MLYKTFWSLMANNDQGKDPLERLVVDKEEIDRERLADAIDGLLSVDGETGDLVPRPGYHDLDNKSKFVARLLARRAAATLGIIEESTMGASSGEFSERMEPSESTIQNYGGLDFVENDDAHGGYYIPSHSIELAIAHLEEVRDSD